MGLIESLFKLIENIFNFSINGISKIVGFSGNVFKTISSIEKKSRKRKEHLKKQKRWLNKNINNKNEII